ncbi:uncharacterized protein FIESC28_11149 [Fusarium coffeatum]|uniref:Uncharacterized protein n=1 Tax=Fusarium coffeatum TaxID=231269 RepID=A0A366QMH9_9HYPO|nr:uncharacterized protein FIESC28_11149 [Fusarium coffeatum]RBR06134.1 hypothetical protein FIESC28_11149 [Fusarium coffeatum]
MTTWQEFAQYQASKEPFLKRITTLQGFYNACTDSAFLAISIKDIKKTSDSDRVLAQVGLAYLPSLEPGEHLECSSANMPSLVQFYNHKRVKALTLNVRIPKDEMRQILANGEMPVRRDVRFGQHQDGVLTEYLDASISGFLDGCLHNSHKKDRKLVCVGFNDKAWTYMRNYFPNALYYFSAYMDLRDIVREATPNTGHIPSLKKCLELFHFNGELTRTEKVGEKTDNAGEHAVGVCAFATILLSEENQEMFKYRMECATMARHWEHKRIRRRFTAEARFLVSVCTAAREALPYELKTSWRIAQHFHPWNPKYAVRASRTEAYAQFQNKPDMEMFIRDMNGAVYPSGEILSVKTYEQREEELEEESGQEDCDNEEEEDQQESGQQPEDHQQGLGQQEETHEHAGDKQEDNTQPARLEKSQQQYCERPDKTWIFQEVEQFLERVKNWTYPSAREMTNPQETEGEDNNVETEQQGWGQPEWCRQQEINRLTSLRQKEDQYWDQKEDWAQPPKWDFQEKENQQQEIQERTAWNSAREVWPRYEGESSEEETSEETSEEESEEEQVNDKEQVEEEEDNLHASGWFGEDEMPELVEANPETDWEVISD